MYISNISSCTQQLHSEKTNYQTGIRTILEDVNKIYAFNVSSFIHIYVYI